MAYYQAPPPMRRQHRYPVAAGMQAFGAILLVVGLFSPMVGSPTAEILLELDFTAMTLLGSAGAVALLVAVFAAGSALLIVFGSTSAAVGASAISAGGAMATMAFAGWNLVAALAAQAELGAGTFIVSYGLWLMTGGALVVVVASFTVALRLGDEIIGGWGILYMGVAVLAVFGVLVFALFALESTLNYAGGAPALL
jgi:hypothetical protein